MSWIEGFLDAAKRRGLSPKTIETYSDTLNRITNHQKLNLETCTQQEVFAFQDKKREAHSLSYHTLHVSLIKMALVFLERKDLAEAIEFPRRRDPAESIKMLAPEEVERLIRGAPTLQDRLPVELFSETGGRRGELARVRIRDIQFDQYGTILWLNGKTGVCRRRVYACVPELREHINNHPQRANPDALLFYKQTGEPYTYETLHRRIKKIGDRILGKAICPKMFRYTRATEDSRHFTDREI